MDPTSKLGQVLSKHGPEVRSKARQYACVFVCVEVFPYTFAGTSLFGLTQHVRPARQGFDFSLQQVYLLEGVSLSDDPLSFISDQRNGCKSFSMLQYFLRMENNKGLLIL